MSDYMRELEERQEREDQAKRMLVTIYLIYLDNNFVEAHRTEATAKAAAKTIERIAQMAGHYDQRDSPYVEVKAVEVLP